MLKDKNIVVTGGSGMIGRSLIKLLKNHSVKDIYNFSIDANFNSVEDVINVSIDLRDYSALDNVLEDICLNDTIIFHLAGIKGNPDAAINRPASFFVPMLQFNSNIIRAAIDNQVEHILYTSSVGVYAPSEYFTEGVNDTIPSTKDWYAGWAKRTGEMTLEAYSKQYNWNNYSIIRPANVFGPHDNFDPKNAMVIPSLIHKMIDNPTQDLELHGDGSNERDFIYCDDVARAMIFMVENKLTGPMNIGSGSSYTIEALVQDLVKLTDFKRNIKWNGLESGDKKRIMNISKIKTAGFQLETSFKDGLEQTIEWYKTNKDILGIRYDAFK